MIAEVYDALLSAGADEGKARRAAEVLTSFDDKFASVEQRIDQMERRIDRRIDAVERRIDSVERRIDVLESNMNGRFAALEAKFDGKFNLLYGLSGILVAGNITLVINSFVHL